MISKHEILNTYFLVYFLLFWMEFDRNFEKYIWGIIVVCAVEREAKYIFFIIAWFDPPPPPPALRIIKCWQLKGMGPSEDKVICNIKSK